MPSSIFATYPMDRASSSQMDFHRDISYYGTIGREDLGSRESRISARTPASSITCRTSTIVARPSAWCRTATYVRHAGGSEGGQGEAYREIPIRGKAGTAVLYNITTYHTRKGGSAECTHGRRTMHNYHSRASSYAADQLGDGARGTRAQRRS